MDIVLKRHTHIWQLLSTRKTKQQKKNEETGSWNIHLLLLNIDLLVAMMHKDTHFVTNEVEILPSMQSIWTNIFLMLPIFCHFIFRMQGHTMFVTIKWCSQRAGYTGQKHPTRWRKMLSGNNGDGRHLQRVLCVLSACKFVQFLYRTCGYSHWREDYRASYATSDQYMRS